MMKLQIRLVQLDIHLVVDSLDMWLGLYAKDANVYDSMSFVTAMK